MIVHPRTDWQAATQPVTGPAYPTDRVVDVVYHYPGVSPDTKFTDPARSLRAMQSGYLTNRGYSLGYNYAIDPVGAVWEIRGVDIRAAATAGYNSEGVTVLIMVGGQAPANDVQLTAIIDLHRWLEEYHGRLLGVTGHCFKGSTVTPCPGAGIVRQLPDIERWLHDDGDVPAPPPDEEDDDMGFLAKGDGGSLFAVGSDLHKVALYGEDWSALASIGWKEAVGMRTDTVDRLPSAGFTDVIGDKGGTA